jgi:hypothetical protein
MSNKRFVRDSNFRIVEEIENGKSRFLIQEKRKFLTFENWVIMSVPREGGFRELEFGTLKEAAERIFEIRKAQKEHSKPKKVWKIHYVAEQEDLDTF